MRTPNTFLFQILILSLLSSCVSNKSLKTIIIKNTLNFDRHQETIELNKTQLNIESLDNLGILNTETNELEITQLVDENNDGIFDILLFQPKVSANSSVIFKILKVDEIDKPKPKTICYSRFVPERTDDYAWENDKVAFRVFGPTAQKMAENNVSGGTLSSGVDAWLKRVNHPIINTWYKKTIDGTGSYHEDTGEGLDNFHVGTSRGVGGISILKDSTYFVPKNFINYRTITTGPIRTSFYLEYADWKAGNKIIQESMIVNLDAGQNLSEFKVSIFGNDDILAGLTLHEKDGQISVNNNLGWLSYWEPHEDSELGMAILANKNFFNGYHLHKTDTPDMSNAYTALKIIDNATVYYAGFGWKKAGDFKTQQEWEAYLNHFSRCINTPLVIEIL